MSPLDALKVSVFISSVGPLNPADAHLGSAPPAPFPCSQLCQWVPEIPAPRNELKWHCRGDLVLSCRICTTGAETELPQGNPWTPNPTSPFPYPTLQPGTIPFLGKGRGQFIARPGFSGLLHHIIWTEQAHSQFYCQSSASFRAGSFPPGGISLSLYKNPNNQPQSFQKPSKTPPFFLYSP